jgi:hypothetical protein
MVIHKQHASEVAIEGFNLPPAWKARCLYRSQTTLNTKHHEVFPLKGTVLPIPCCGKSFQPDTTSWLKYTPAAKDYQQIERNFSSQARTRNNNISLQYPNLLLINRELALLYQLPATNKGRRNTVGWKKSSRPRSSDAHSQLLFIHEDIKTRNSDTHSQLLSVHEDFKNKTLRHYSQLLFEHLECELSWPRSFSG